LSYRPKRKLARIIFPESKTRNGLSVEFAEQSPKEPEGFPLYRLSHRPKRKLARIIFPESKTRNGLSVEFAEQSRSMSKRARVRKRLIVEFAKQSPKEPEGFPPTTFTRLIY